MDKQECINDLVRVYEIIGRIPKRSEYRTHGSIGSNTITRVFGSFSEAKNEAFGEAASKGLATKQCGCCGTDVTRKKALMLDKVYCSRKCSAKANNNRRGTGECGYGVYTLKVYANNNKVVGVKLCEVCDTPIRRGCTRFCSIDCHKQSCFDEYIKQWKSGDAPKTVKTSSYIRRYLLLKYDNKCSRCGWDEINPFSGKIPLEVEHIDGNSENDSEANLTILCPNCHSLTSTYRALNVGNGRAYRRERYKQGKSF